MKPNWLPSGSAGHRSRRLAILVTPSDGRLIVGQVIGVPGRPSAGKYFGVSVIATELLLWKLKRCANDAVSTTSGNTWIEW
jgi:hypothetical protein